MICHKCTKCTLCSKTLKTQGFGSVSYDGLTVKCTKCLGKEQAAKHKLEEIERAKHTPVQMRKKSETELISNSGDRFTKTPEGYINSAGEKVTPKQMNHFLKTEGGKKLHKASDCTDGFVKYARDNAQTVGANAQKRREDRAKRRETVKSLFGS